MAKELGSTERTLNIVLVGVLLVYGIVNIYLVVNAYNKLDANVDILGDIVNNWKTNTITDIRVLSTGSACSTLGTGFESALKDRYWPGVDDGCYCNPSIVTETQKTDKNVTCSPFCTGTCSANAQLINCENVAGRSKQLLNYVGTLGGNPSQICVQRSSESFSTVGSANKDGSCPSGYTTCGTGNNMYCTKLGSCPVSSILIESGSTCLSGYTCYQLTSGLYVKFAKGVDGTLPLAELTLNEYAMCDIKSEDNITPGRKTFSLIDTKPTTCYAQGDDKWSYTATVTEADLFTANSLDAYITTLAAYDDTANNMNGYYENGLTGANFNWKVATRGYIPWKAGCRDKVDSFIKKKTFVDKSQSAQLALLVIGIISTLFLSVVLGIMEIQNLRGVDLSCFDGKGEEERTKLKRFKKFVNYGFKFLQVPFQLWAIFLAAGAKNLFAAVAADSCSSDEINANILYLSKNLASTHKSNLTALAILVATLIFDLILAAWEARKNKNAAGTTAVTPSSQPAQEINISSARPLTFDQSSNPSSPVKPQQQQQPQPQGQTVTIQLQQQPQQPAPMQFGQPQQPAPMQFGQPQQQAPMQFGQPQQQYPQQQPAPMQFGQPQQPAPMQFGQPQQQYPQQQAPMQFAPQQYPQQQQQYPRY